MTQNLSQLVIIDWQDDAILALDQRLLPEQEVHLRLSTMSALEEAIHTLAVRGAPALGVAGAFGVALAAQLAPKTSWDAFYNFIQNASQSLASTRPTAVNLHWGIERLLTRLRQSQELCLNLPPLDDIAKILLDEAIAVKNEDIATNKRIGQHGAELLEDGDVVLTHCNAGALCSAGYGTALGVIYAAVAQGKKISVFADETRPLLQGSRLTAWELQRHGVPVTVICDNMAATVMAQGKVSKIITGADRIVANGDAANKIGTYGLAILAQHHKLPFYIAAPFSTIDFSKSDGSQIPIEQRSRDEIINGFGRFTAPKNIEVFNPAFDVTPAPLISALVTEKGIIKSPFKENLARLRSLI